jgi:hypothetical protein
MFLPMDYPFNYQWQRVKFLLHANTILRKMVTGKCHSQKMLAGCYTRFKRGCREGLVYPKAVVVKEFGKKLKYTKLIVNPKGNHGKFEGVIT